VTGLAEVNRFVWPDTTAIQASVPALVRCETQGMTAIAELEERIEVPIEPLAVKRLGIERRDIEKNDAAPLRQLVRSQLRDRRLPDAALAADENDAAIG